jgi:imidazolonepropionase-like amidohydrolase
MRKPFTRDFTPTVLVLTGGVALLAAVLFIAPSPAGAAPPAGTLVLTGERLIDGTGHSFEKGVLIVRDGRIVGAGAEGSVAVPADGHNIDLSGRTIMPGLISAHSHLGLVEGASAANPANYNRANVARQLAQYERYGVTAVMSLGVNRDVLYTWRDEQRAGQLPGADIFTADRGLGVPGGAPPFPVPEDQMYRPKTPDEARADVREMAARNPDILKLWLDDIFGTMPKMQPAIYTAAIAEAHASIDEAHQHGLRMAAHIFYLDDAKALLKVGVDVIGHSVRDRGVDEEFIQLMKARHIPYIATLSLDESQFIYAEHPAWMNEPFFTNAVDPALLATWLSPAYAAKIRDNPNTAKERAALATASLNLMTLHDAGVVISFGTDSGAMPTRVAGFDEHRELQLMVKAGLSPMQAIVAATKTAAETIGDGAHRGTLEAGKRADFLVLKANPLQDIKNTETLEAVWHGGVFQASSPSSPEKPSP